MSVELMIYIYLFICFAMILFNIFTAIILKKKDKKTIKVSEDFNYKVGIQLDKVRNGLQCDDEHLQYMHEKLRKVGNMTAFDKMLEVAYQNDSETVKKYLCQLDSVFVSLCDAYCRKDKIDAAYFPYIVKKYSLISFRPLTSIIESMFTLLDEPSIYCRENAMQALYSSGDSDYVIKALQKIDKSDLFYHGKLIYDGLLNFVGNTKELIDKIISKFNTFSTDMQVNLLNYIRFASADYCDFFYSILCDETQNDEIRYAAIRYLGKYHYGQAYSILCNLAKKKEMDKWQYPAIAASALAIYPGEDTIELLKQNLYSYNWYIRYNSAESLERLGITYTELADVLEGNDRYAAEILRYRLQRREKGETLV